MKTSKYNFPAQWMNSMELCFFYFTKRREFKWKWKQKVFSLLLLNCIYSTAFAMGKSKIVYCIDIWHFHWLVSRFLSSVLWINLLAFKIFFYSFFLVTFSYYYIYEFGTKPKGTKHSVTLFFFFNSLLR